MDDLKAKLLVCSNHVVMIEQERDNWRSRYAALDAAAHSTPASERLIEQKMVLAELESIRQLIESSPCGEAWEHIMTCGVLATAVALKQRILKSPSWNRTQRKDFSRLPTTSANSIPLPRSDAGAAPRVPTAKATISNQSPRKRHS